MWRWSLVSNCLEKRKTWNNHDSLTFMICLSYFFLYNGGWQVCSKFKQKDLALSQGWFLILFCWLAKNCDMVISTSTLFFCLTIPCHYDCVDISSVVLLQNVSSLSSYCSRFFPLSKILKLWKRKNSIRT